MMLHVLHWLAKWFMTVIAVCAFINMCKTVNRPLGTRWVTRGGRRIRKTTVDNVLDGTGAVYGFVMLGVDRGAAVGDFISTAYGRCFSRRDRIIGQPARHIAQ